MQINTIEEDRWQEYFNEVTGAVSDNAIHIEILGSDIGLQVLVEDGLLKGFYYNPDDKTLEVSTESLRHIVYSPEQVNVTLVSDKIDSMEIIDAQKHHQIIQLLTPLAFN